jgi:hypothetical protein
MTPNVFAIAVRVAFVAAALLAAGCDDEPLPVPPTDGGAPQRLPTATIRVGPHELAVEVADEEAERQRGMMFRRSLGPDEAMLFIFPGSTQIPFWMKNTYVDLDLAFVAADGTILQVEPMTALNTEGVYSREPYRYVLETPRGWFEAHRIEPGDRVTIPTEVAGPGPGRPPG